MKSQKHIYEIYTKNIPGATSFHTWSALTILGAAATGRVQIFEEPNAIHPNLMTILVGLPSAGKSVAANTARSIFSIASQLKSNMQIYDYNGTLKDIVHEVTTAPSTSNYTVFSEEANIIFNGAKHLQIVRTIKLYNSGRISLLTGVQADQFKHVFPRHLFDLSLLPRAHFVIADKTPMPKVFQHNDLNSELRAELEHDLKIIMRLSGEITFSKKARDLINHWWVDELGADLSQLEHPMLTQYNEKRIIHLLKLAMICSMSRTNSLVVKKKDVTRAFKIMTDNEKLLAVHADQI